jgi:hypothetical protein
LLHPTLQVDQVTVEHLQQHFVNFARNDNLGQISTWLLAQTDALGPASSECLQLAVLHSTAVDFPKTGKPAEINFELMRKLVSHLTAAAYAMQYLLAVPCLAEPIFCESSLQALHCAGRLVVSTITIVSCCICTGPLYPQPARQQTYDCTAAYFVLLVCATCVQRPERFPAFMQNKDQQSYESSKVLGRMYDRVLAHPVTKHLQESDAAANLAAKNAISSRSSSTQQSIMSMRWPYQLLQVAEVGSSWRQLVSAAEQEFAVFDRELVALMNHWGVYNLGGCFGLTSLWWHQVLLASNGLSCTMVASARDKRTPNICGMSPPYAG